MTTRAPRTPLRLALSHTVGWLADRRIPGPLRKPVFRTYCALTGADAGEARGPLGGYPSLGAFFVRRLAEGARPLAADPGSVPSPADATLQAVNQIESGTLLQAKGRPYAVSELLAGMDAGLELEGGLAITLYLSPRDYHRVHAPADCHLGALAWVAGSRYSVQPSVLLRHARVLSVNERAVLRLETERGPCLLVMVGALNVGRIRVVGVEPGRPAPEPPKHYARGAELARFEMGSTVVLVWPAGVVEAPELPLGHHLRMGEELARWKRAPVPSPSPAR